MSSIIGIGVTLAVWPPISVNSRVAQWKRAGPITQRSVDRNYALLIIFVFQPTKCDQLWIVARWKFSHAAVPLAQRIARWTSNPKVLGSIPRWDELFSPFDIRIQSPLLTKVFSPFDKKCLAAVGFEPTPPRRLVP